MLCYVPQVHNALVWPLCVNGRLVKSYRRFGELYCLHPQSLDVQELLEPEDDLF